MAKKDFKMGISNNINSNRGIGNLISTQIVEEDKKEISDVSEDEYVRQTFIIRQSLLEKIKDYTHKRKSENYSITQKEILEEILILFFEEVGELESRPESVRSIEIERKINIRNGKNK